MSGVLTIFYKIKIPVYFFKSSESVQMYCWLHHKIHSLGVIELSFIFNDILQFVIAIYNRVWEDTFCSAKFHKLSVAKCFTHKICILRPLINCTFFDRRQTQRVVWRELICRGTTVFY
jgi:hypothetical protein